MTIRNFFLYSKQSYSEEKTAHPDGDSQSQDRRISDAYNKYVGSAAWVLPISCIVHMDQFRRNTIGWLFMNILNSNARKTLQDTLIYSAFQSAL